MSMLRGSSDGSELDERDVHGVARTLDHAVHDAEEVADPLELYGVAAPPKQVSREQPIRALTKSSPARHQSFTGRAARRGSLSVVQAVAYHPGAAPAETIGAVEIRPTELQAFVDGVRVNFTVREFQLFYALASRWDRVVSRAELYSDVWGGDMPQRDRSVDVFIRKIRSKLLAVSPGWTFIHTHFGIGYRFAPQRRRGGPR